MSIDESLHDKVESSGNLKVNRHRIEFYGLCERCLEN
jgi:Fe2+ or Zn2+ uptake regulation protein